LEEENSGAKISADGFALADPVLSVKGGVDAVKTSPVVGFLRTSGAEDFDGGIVCLGNPSLTSSLVFGSMIVILERGGVAPEALADEVTPEEDTEEAEVLTAGTLDGEVRGAVV